MIKIDRNKIFKKIGNGEKNRAEEFLENMGGEESFKNLMSEELSNGRDTELANKFYNAVICGQQTLE